MNKTKPNKRKLCECLQNLVERMNKKHEIYFHLHIIHIQQSTNIGRYNYGSFFHTSETKDACDKCGTKIYKTILLKDNLLDFLKSTDTKEDEQLSALIEDF